MSKPRLGKLALEAVGLTELPRLAPGLLAGLRGLADLTGTLSDALDELGIAGVVPGSVLRPTDPRARIVGQAITVFNQALSVRSEVSKLADIEAHNLAEPGDVLVVQGVAGISSMGGISASIGARQGEAGAIVDGAVRDVEHSRRIGYPVWATGVSPITGKWRLETKAVNRPVQIAGIEVQPGDVVAADEVGVCFVPFARAAEVLAVAQRLGQWEAERLRKLTEGIPLAEFAAIPRPKR
jgi:4-hydroxy-4-methyl-2-oxoglutarate aldolase